MKKLILVVLLAAVCPTLKAQYDYGGAPGHLPFPHDHSGTCGPTGGVCYGYAMGTL